MANPVGIRRIVYRDDFSCIVTFSRLQGTVNLPGTIVVHKEIRGLGGAPKDATVNWSSIGTVDPDTAQLFSIMLNDAATLARNMDAGRLPQPE